MAEGEGFGYQWAKCYSLKFDQALPLPPVEISEGNVPLHHIKNMISVGISFINNRFHTDALY